MIGARHPHLAQTARALAVSCVVAVLVALTGARDVLAHGSLSRSEPAADQTLDGAPDRVRLVFSELLDTSGTSVSVLDVSGARIDRGDQAIAPGGREASVGIIPLGPGVYTVAWQALSLEDGHTVKGHYAFTVGVPNPPTVLSIQGPDGSEPAQATVGNMVVRLAQSPSPSGHQFDIAISSNDEPVTDIQRVTLRFVVASLDFGSSSITATPNGAGHFLASTWLPSLAGRWRVETSVRRMGQDDVSATFDVQVGS